MFTGNRMDIAVIHWVDAWIDTVDMGVDQAKKQKAINRSTCGYLVSENDEGVLLATDRYRGGKEVNSPMFIPWGMIKTYEILEVV